MEIAIRERYSDDILSEARKRYGIDPGTIKLLDGFESFIYAFEKDGDEFVLRISHTIRRSPDLIAGEVDWINYLHKGGVGVARAISSQNGRFVELISDGQEGHFLAVAFTRAKGGSAWEHGRWNKVLFFRYGRLLGRIHALSKRYEPRQPSWRRLQWDDPANVHIYNWLPADHGIVVAKSKENLATLRALPKDRESYGLIHQDAHGGNFFVDAKGEITLFDFDDCVYGWFIYDIAMVIFYAVTNHEYPQAAAAELWPEFWRGYCLENDLDPAWLSEIPAFLKLREIDLYAVIHRSFDVDSLVDSWVAQFMAGRRDRIEKEMPYLDFVFTA